MPKKILLSLVAACCIFLSAVNAQTSKPKDYLSVPGPLVFEKLTYNLDWTSHPTANFYKQEYLVKGDTAGKYKTMLMIDVMITGKTIKEIAGEKINELKQMKASNPVINYEVFDNPTTGEYMIDFILSANTPDGKSLSIVERNVYKYKAFTDKAGKKGVYLFGVSTRAYGNSITGFLTALKTTKSQLVNQVAKYAMPQIVIAK